MDSFSLVILGVTGNLTQIKLIPALYDLEANRLLPPNARILGIARKPSTATAFRRYLDTVLHQHNRHHLHPIDRRIFLRLCRRFHYLSGDVTDPKFYPRLRQILTRSSGRHNIIFYLATFPDLYGNIFRYLHRAHLTNQKSGWVRIIVEKPIGTDLKSARNLNQMLLKYFVEDQIFRLDHYLGKETLQNILNFRFGNDVFEPQINAEFVDHIQITAAEDFGIGSRGSYYDTVGALKDIGQNHLLQMLALATMDPPQSFDSQALTSQRLKLLRSLTPLRQSLVLGQYTGYHQETNVSPHSVTDTFFAFKAFINSDRFRHVPIYFRAGKQLAAWVTEIAIVFKLPQPRLFRDSYGGMEPNVLIYRIQPNQGIVLKILVKTPGYDKKIEPAYMQFCYQHLSSTLPDPYERLIYDVIRGDQTFFNDAPEIETQWACIEQLLPPPHPPSLYRPGSWGPPPARTLMRRDGREWLEPSLAFCQFYPLF